jgi:uncharacterized ferritin-like protein (DUF455 family)
MEIREFAERILLGTTWEDKYLSATIFTDAQPGKALLSEPHSPGRMEELRLDRWQKETKVAFPNSEELRDPYMRGIVFHFFANHELLAMELMALFLMRFPDAPTEMRMGIARTIQEEQTHMQLYAHRMQHLGVKFGAIAVNDFFWTCMSKMSSPLEFVTHMSMTFEQANLDFSLSYSKLLRKVGDDEGAAILDQVYRDEIGHVKHGLKWFRMWKDYKKPDWQAYLESLNFPVTASRAKGFEYSEEARRLAGFDEDYIRELAVYSHSKGRPPKIFCFNPGCEGSVARGKPGFRLGTKELSLAHDLTALPLFLASQDDIVVVTEAPGTSFLESLRKVGFSIPEFIVAKSAAHDLAAPKLSVPKVMAFEPWGWSPDVAKLFQPVAEKLVSKSDWQHSMVSPQFPSEQLQEFFSKSVAAKLLIEAQENLGIEKLLPHELPYVCTQKDQVFETLERLFAEGSKMCVIKAPYSTSGQRRIKLRPGEKNGGLEPFVCNTLADEGSVLVENWLDKCADFSLQLKVDDSGNSIILGHTRFLTDQKGQYLASAVGRFLDGLEKDELRYLYRKNDAGLTVLEQLEEIGLFVAQKLASKGYRGPIGIDALLFRRAGNHKETAQFGFRYLVEINPRYTMGRLALELAKRLYPGSLGLWYHVNKWSVAKLGYESLQHFQEAVLAKNSLALEHHGAPQIRRGVIFTTPIKKETLFATVLVAGRNQADCAEQIGIEYSPEKTGFQIPDLSFHPWK